MGLMAVLVGCGGGGGVSGPSGTLTGTVQTLPGRQALTPVASGTVQVYLDGNQVASGVIASGQYRVTVPLPPDVSQATVVVTANFVAGSIAQRRKHKTVAVVRVNATQQADINPTTTLATAALEQAPNTVPPDLDINAFVQAQQNLQDIDLTQVDFSSDDKSDDKIQQALPVMLVVTSNPSGAQVLINGQPQQQASTPFFLRSGLQGGADLTVQVRRQATIGNETITTTLSKSVTLKVRGSTPVHFDFTPQIVSAQVANGALNLQVKNAGSANEKVIVRFGDTQAVVATIASVDEQGVATISVTIPQGVSGQVQVRVQNAARTSAAQNVSI
jgi:HSP20 family molecular chaperone IbpA